MFSFKNRKKNCLYSFSYEVRDLCYYGPEEGDKKG